MPPEKRVEMPAEYQQRKDHTGREHGIHTVQHAAMARYQAAGILVAETALDQGFEQVTGMGGEAEDKAEQHGEPDVEAEESDIEREHNGRGDAAADGAGPGLSRRKPGRDLLAADKLAEHQGARVGGPHDQE